MPRRRTLKVRAQHFADDRAICVRMMAEIWLQMAIVEHGPKADDVHERAERAAVLCQSMGFHVTFV